MKWATRIIQGLLIIDFLIFGITKLTGSTMMVQEFTKVYGYSVTFMYIVGILEVLGALGLFIGYWKSKIAVLASGGLVLIMVGAIFTLLKIGQGMNSIMPFIVLILTLIVFTRNRSALKQKAT